ncbi:MAG: precorrin-2 C(20)-methyltransferase, partial [Nitrospirae bacterium]|nr:precorrin-2 C(20)-methyltransferase [Nitrospirota bacterium]
MTGSLYVIGVGPGDPELLTLKAVRILKTVNCICVPKGREEGSSLALSIVKKALNLDGKEIIEAYFPMRKTKTPNTENPPIPPLIKGGEGGFKDCELDYRWQQTVETVLSRLNKGTDTVFITLGDPAVYSTFFYLFDRLLELNPALNIEIIPGVSSINASAAAAKISLGLADEKIAILPANYIDDLARTLMNFDSVVLMKVHKVFN